MATLGSVKASTPPPPTSIRTPPTPRLGWEDDYQPYAPRVTTRSQQRARVTRTPPRQSSGAGTKDTIHSTRFNKQDTGRAYDTDSTPPTSPPTATKRAPARHPDIMRGRRISGALTLDTTEAAAQALGVQQSVTKNDQQNTRVSNTLPTPAKTPVTRSSKDYAGLQKVARTLFQTHERVEDAMPHPKVSGRNKFLESFEAVQHEPISIFTDSQDRIPEVDDSEENPFYCMKSQPEPSKGGSARRRLGIAEDTVDVADHHKDGMFYVFRGKKIFRKFDDIETPERSFGADSEEDDVEMGQGSSIPAHLRKPLTRSAMKPRLLFPPKTYKSDMDDDEEAETDIEQPESSMTPKRQVSVSTPKAPRFAPFTPPTTVRATRSKDMIKDLSKDVDMDEADTSGDGKKVSPFNGWQRVKSNSSTNKKRNAEHMTPGSTQGKRLRGGGVRV